MAGILQLTPSFRKNGTKGNPMKLGAVALVMLALFGLAGTIAYTVLKPSPEASAPIQSVALQPATAPASAGTVTRFEIQPGESEARFIIDEVLRGEPKTVVGTTNQVAGQIAVDPTNPNGAQIGTILINARTLTTDSEARNRSLKNLILETEAHEYISFQATELLGLPERAGVGDVMSLKVVGDLTIRGVTRPVTFDATVMPETASRLEGSAVTTIRYADWGISIPQVPAVAGVSEQVQLELTFVATA